MGKILQFPQKDIYQLKIILKNTKSPIWRRIVVASDLPLPDLHKIIQTVMGWTNSHMHQFMINGKFYSELDDEAYYELIDYNDIILSEVLQAEKESIEYEYDFGDGWQHKIILEKIFQDGSQIIPLCLTGKRSCPPEDCGGPLGYEDLLEIIADKQHEEYEETIEWLGGEFDPKDFNIQEINESLQEEDFGCIVID